MREEFKRKLHGAVIEQNVDKAWALIEAEYEFKCPSFVYAGPGHQSKHTCDYRRPHPIEGEHSDDMYEWEGTTVMEGNKLVSNAKHHGDGSCGH